MIPLLGGARGGFLIKTKDKSTKTKVVEAGKQKINVKRKYGRKEK
jgi:hypothetical protein